MGVKTKNIRYPIKTLCINSCRKTVVMSRIAALGSRRVFYGLVSLYACTTSYFFNFFFLEKSEFSCYQIVSLYRTYTSRYRFENETILLVLVSVCNAIYFIYFITRNLSDILSTWGLTWRHFCDINLQRFKGEIRKDFLHFPRGWKWVNRILRFIDAFKVWFLFKKVAYENT